ncbi:hypothetical protein FHL15_003334 [Xylaria flabelliformis]|uniref:Uncharacterized protein n=1 Tax=Xylaria flabelliformis TaxID=2512241 RepID=A0A553I6E7_9PEZI|nr:hypothetical protein FHL15_003334 [Xylaria flabelliformis]
MAEPSPSLLWTIVLPVSALSLALGSITPFVTIYTVAYLAAPREITTFVDAIDCSIQENENYDCDIAKVTRLEDKVRLSRLLREIQKQGDDLRENLNDLVVDEGGTTLRTSARVLWAAHRKQLEERVRRLDMLRMRFLVVFMGIVATTAGERTKDVARTAPKEKVIPPAPPPPPPVPQPPAPGLTRAHTDSVPRTPMRRLTTQAIGYSEKTEYAHRSGWFGVVAELQRSPILRQRHASIEAAMRATPPNSPVGSPLAGLRPVKGTPVPETLNEL